MELEENSKVIKCCPYSCSSGIKCLPLTGAWHVLHVLLLSAGHRTLPGALQQAHTYCSVYPMGSRKD